MLELLLLTPVASEIEKRVFAEEETLHAPHLIDLEVAQVLGRYCASGELDAERGEQALTDLADLPLTRYPHDLFLPRIRELMRHVTAYDAAYLALAEALPAPLLTLDARLAALAGLEARVECL